MNSWAVLDRSDPAPGDVAGTRGLGESLLRQASDIEAQTARLRALVADRGSLQMAGGYAPSYSDTLEVLPGGLSKLGLAYHRCGTALTAFAGALNEAKGRAGNALRSGQDADVRYRAAIRQLQLLLPATAGLTVDLGTSLNLMGAEAAAGLDAGTREQIQVAVRQAQNARQDLDRARGLADQAAALRNDAEETCVKQINSALEESGIKNKSWLEKAWNTATFNSISWDEFIRVCRDGALVAGILAMVLTGPIGISLAVTALSASAVVFADGVARYSNGEIGIGTLALDGVGVLPGGIGLEGGLSRLVPAVTFLRDVVTDSSRAATLSGQITRESTTLGRAAIGRRPQSVEEIQTWLREVNPGYYGAGSRSENCAKCAIAVVKRLNGEPAVADLGIHSVREMEAITGVKQVRMSPKEIAEALKTKGPGSTAIVGIDRSMSFGHWFNAYYDGKNVVAIDGQSGKIFGWPPDYDLPGAPVTIWDAGVL